MPRVEYIRTAEMRKHMSESHKGIPSGMKGKHHSEETKRKIGLANKGKHRTEETKKKISEFQKGRISNMKGKRHSEETKKKMSKANKGQIPWMKGKHHTEESKEKMRKLLKDRFFSIETRMKLRESHKGSKAYNWKGGVSKTYKKHRLEVGWSKIALRVYKRDDFKCQLCGRNYKLNAHHIIPWRIEHNDKISNLITLCKPCHGRIESKWKQYSPIFFKILGNCIESEEKKLFQ